MSIRTTTKSSQRALAIRVLALCLALVCIGTLTGCGNFWLPISSSTTTNTGTGFDLVYAGKNSSDSFVGYAVTSSGLTAVTGSPFSLSSPPLSMAINPADTYLYVGTTVGIYGYSIAAGGPLTALNSGSVVANTPAALGNGPVSMDISPDGNWLAVLTANTGGSVSIFTYQITSSTGLLTYIDTASLVTSATAVVHTIKFSPNEDLLAATLGTGGTAIFTFGSTTGAISTSFYGLTPPISTDSDNSAVFSAAGTTIFISRGGSAAELFYYPINATTGTVNTTSGLAVTTGTNPTALAFNSNDSTITGYPITVNSTTSVTTLGSQLYGSPYSTVGITPFALAHDNSGLYMLTLTQSGPPDLIEYTVDPTAATVGRLYITGSVSTGLTSITTSVPGVTMVTTH